MHLDAHPGEPDSGVNVHSIHVHMSVHLTQYSSNMHECRATISYNVCGV